MKKIMIIGEIATLPTGFGQQCYYLAAGLTQKGYNVTVVGSSYVGLNIKRQKIPGVLQLECPYSDINLYNKYIKKIKPDVVICLLPIFVYDELFKVQSLALNCPFFLWIAWEGTNIPARIKDKFKNIESFELVHLNKYAQTLWKEITETESPVIPHCVDLNIFKPAKDKLKARKKLSQRIKQYLPENKPLILVVDRNNWRKNLDLCIDVARRLKEENTDFTLLFHCTQTDKTGANLPSIAAMMNVADVVKFTGFEWTDDFTREEVALLYQASDFRLSCSSGEGFGIPSIEALACGCVNVTPSNTAFKGVLGEEFIIQDIGIKTISDTLWSVPNVKGIVDRIKDLIEDQIEYRRLQELSIERAKEFEVHKVIDQWDKRLKDIPSLESIRRNRRKGLESIDDQVHLKIKMATAFTLVEAKDIIDVGSGGGEFIEIGTLKGLNVVGVEKDCLFDMCQSDQANFSTIWGDALALEYTKYKGVVITNFLQDLKEDQIDIFLEKISTCQWIFFSSYDDNVWSRWAKNKLTKEEITKRFKDLGFIRNLKVEAALMPKLGTSDLGFEVWQPGEYMGVILPVKLM